MVHIQAPETRESFKFSGSHLGGMARITVDSKKCNGCGDCESACSASVFSMVAGKAKPVNPDDCIDCCACVDICEPEAIDHENCLL